MVLLSKTALLATVLGTLAFSNLAHAANCGNTSAGFDQWKTEFAKTARKSGVKKPGLQALAQASYATGTIAADRNQKSFKFTLEKFMQVRGAETIVAQGRKRKARNPAFYAALEKKYGVPAGILLALHGMETAFGGYMGDSPIVSAITTLAYDCRRSEFFIPHAIGALKLVGEGKWTPDDVSRALKACDRAACAPVAPAHGLYLARVDY